MLNKLDSAFSETVAVSRTGLWLLALIVVFLAVFLVQNIANKEPGLVATSTGKNKISKIYGEIQTESINSGQILTGTLKDYRPLAQTWSFLSDDDRLFHLKLDQPPAFYKIEEKLNIYVVSCQKNAFGHVVLIASREKVN